MSDDEDPRVETAGAPLYSTRERDYYPGFTLNEKVTFRVHDIVFLDQLGREATNKLDAKERLRSWWIGALESIFIERGDRRREVYCGIRWFYRDADFAPALGSLPAGFGADSDELIFSDHYDENPATSVEAVADVKMWLDGVAMSAPKLPRDGRHFASRWMWLTKDKRLLDISTAVTLDGDQPERAVQLLRVLVKKSLGAKIPQHYRDPAGPIDYELAAGGKKKSSSAASTPANDKKRSSSNGSSKKKLVKRARDDGEDEENDNENDDEGESDDDINGDNVDVEDDSNDAKKKSKKSKAPSSASKQAKKVNVKRHPTFEEASQLLLTRGELAILSSTKSFADVIGGLVLLKHKDDNGAPQTTLFEIDKLPEVDAPYRPYPLTYFAVDGHLETLPDCVAGVELLMDNGDTSRRSLVNVRDRAIDKGDYAAWIAKSSSKSRYPASPTDIKTTIARIDALRKQHTKDKVRAPEPVAN